jgi:hypothetical protein
VRRHAYAALASLFFEEPESLEEAAAGDEESEDGVDSADADEAFSDDAFASEACLRESVR